MQNQKNTDICRMCGIEFKYSESKEQKQTAFNLTARLERNEYTERVTPCGPLCYDCLHTIRALYDDFNAHVQVEFMKAMIPIGAKDVNGNSIYLHDILRNKSGRIVKVVKFISNEFIGYDLNALNSKGEPPVHMWSGWKRIGNHREMSTQIFIEENK